MIFFEIYGEQKTLTQWDLGRRMQVNAPCQQLHFAHEGVPEAVVCPVQETDGVRTARIPDELLQVSGTLWVYAYVKEKEEYTKQIASFFVKERPQPADYVYTPTQWVKMEDLIARVDVLENREETDPTVPAWAKKTKKPTYTAAEVGATPASHATNKNNPHAVTAVQVGARPDTWMPTASEVGAAASMVVTVTGKTSSHSSEEILAHVQAGGTAVLKLEENLYNFVAYDANMCEANFLRIDNMDSEFIENIIISERYCHFRRLELAKRSELSDKADITEVLIATESTNNPGCFYRTVDGETEWYNPPMTPGNEYRTTERINGKAVYKKNDGKMKCRLDGETTWHDYAEFVGARPDTWMPSASDVGAAPGGYGLGGNAASVSNADEIKGTGWYQTNVGTPDDTLWWLIFAFVGDSKYQHQTAYRKYDGLKRERYKVNGVWQEWQDYRFLVGSQGRIAEIDDIKDNGTFRWTTAEGIMVGNVKVNYIHLKVDSWKDDPSSTLVRQTIIHQQYTAQRLCRAGSWDEWEWINPPMTPGVEYRTVERWDGKAVYTKLIHCGAAAPSMNVPFNTPHTNMIRYAGVMSDLALPVESGTNYSRVCLTSTIDVTEDGYDGLNVKVQIWYIKD